MLMATEGVEGLALLEAYTAAVRHNEASHAEAPVEFHLQRHAASNAPEGAMVDQVFGNCHAVVGKIPGDKIIVRGGQRGSVRRVQRRYGAHLLPRSRWCPGYRADEGFGFCGRLHLLKQLRILRSEQVMYWYIQIHEPIHGSTNLVEFMLAIAKKGMLLLEFVEGMNLVDDVDVEGKNLPLGFNELGVCFGKLFRSFFELKMQNDAFLAFDKAFENG
jgi:hypothetical protein